MGCAIGVFVLVFVISVLSFVQFSHWINNSTHYTVWDRIINPFPNVNGTTVEVWKWISKHSAFYLTYAYLCMQGLKLIHVNKNIPLPKSHQIVAYLPTAYLPRQVKNFVAIIFLA